MSFRTAKSQHKIHRLSRNSIHHGPLPGYSLDEQKRGQPEVSCLEEGTSFENLASMLENRDSDFVYDCYQQREEYVLSLNSRERRLAISTEQKTKYYASLGV